MKKLLPIFFAAIPLLAQYCSTATPNCTATLPLGDGSKAGLYYRNYPLDKPNPKIQRAMIIIHGAGRNANDYFATGMASAFLAGALDNTLVIAPRFAGNNGSGCKDPLAPNEISWDCGDWKNGFESLNLKGVYSYDFLDTLIKTIANPKRFPNLKGIVVSGHSAGGQITHRYAAVNRIHNEIRVPIRYVVSNPSSFLYLDANRLPRDFHCDTQGKCEEEFRPYSDRRNCTTYNDWMHGLDNLAGYAAQLTPEQIRTQLLSRPVTYLMGELDTLPIAGFDSSCISMAQGPTRFDRAKAYFAHITRLNAKDHSFVTVPLCGHNNRCIWTADPALPVVFPKF